VERFEEKMKALIIIDMVVRDVKNRKDRNNLIKNQLLLIKAFNKKKQKVILTGGRKDGKYVPPKNRVMLSLWGDEESKSPEENKVIPELLGSKYDYYIDKAGYSAFFRTGLERYCKKHKITELYLAGIFSGVCVYFTGADSAMRGILPIIVSDATGAPSEKRHKINVENFSELLGKAMTAKQILNKLK